MLTVRFGCKTQGEESAEVGGGLDVEGRKDIASGSRAANNNFSAGTEANFEETAMALRHG